MSSRDPSALPFFSDVHPADSPGGLAERIEALLLGKSIKGEVGLYLRKLNKTDGSVPAARGADRVFEPASAIKVLHHLHAILQVQSGSVSLSARIPWNEESSREGEPHEGCPCDPRNPPSLIDLRTGLKQMMTMSDNRATQAVRAFFGEDSINATALRLGMNDTLVRHRIGCGNDIRDDHGAVIDFGARSRCNRTTLVDLGKLYEEVARKGVLTSANQATFCDLMSNESTSGFFKTVVDDEARTLPVDSAGAAAFKRQMRFVWKTGSYTVSGLEHRSIAGWIQLPARDRNGDAAEPRDYVFGLFVDSATSIEEDFDRKAIAKELLRDEIRDALSTFTSILTRTGHDGGDRMRLLARPGSAPQPASLRRF